MTESSISSLRPAAQYLRMSTDTQRYSLENQSIAIAAYAAERGFKVVRSYQDAGRSGVTANRREGLKALLRDVVGGQSAFATILVVDVSRWGRFQDPDEAAHYEFICREAGVQMEYCAEAFDNDGSSAASIMKSLKRVMAADYSRQLSERCIAGKRRQVSRGFAGGGATPYGVRRQAFNQDGTPAQILGLGERRSRLDQTVRVVRGPDEEIAVTRTIFDLFVNKALAYTEIARILNESPPRYLGGKPWNYDRVKGVLTNELAIGISVYNKESGRFVSPGRTAPPSEWLRLKVLEPIVSPALFHAAGTKVAQLKGCSLTDEEMLRKLKALLKQRGRLNCDIIKTSSAVPSLTSYWQRFGSLQAAYALIGYAGPRTRRTLDDEAYRPETIHGRLQSLHKQHGYLSVRLLEKIDDMPSPSYIVTQFGSLREAYALAGFPPSALELRRAGQARRRVNEAEAGPT